MINELVLKTRCFRRFKQKEHISNETLASLVDIARVSASATNAQPLKYIISSNSRTNEMIFYQLAWAGYLKDWGGPADGERPAAYIIILNDKLIKNDAKYDAGIALQNIRLAAMECGIGSCIIGSINKEVLKKELEISPDLEIMLVLAMGFPAEEVIIEKISNNTDIRYWHDENELHHVPKRSIDDVIYKAY